MKITIYGKQMTVRESLKAAIEKKLSKFDKFFGEETEAFVTCRTRKGDKILEITVNYGGTTFRSEEESETFLTALDRAIEALERQIRKNKTRLEKTFKRGAFTKIDVDDDDEYEKVSEDVWVAKSAKVAPSAFIAGPAIIGKGAEVRHCAFIRGKAIVGENAVVGNSVELKNVVIFNNAQVPHYNYVGDSILGYKAHMGAGSITSNLKSDKSLVTIMYKGNKVETGLKKMGAVLGDNVEVGCNSVLNPGTVIGRCSNIYPLSSVRGYVEECSIYKNKDEIVKKS